MANDRRGAGAAHDRPPIETMRWRIHSDDFPLVVSTERMDGRWWTVAVFTDATAAIVAVLSHNASLYAYYGQLRLVLAALAREFGDEEASRD